MPADIGLANRQALLATAGVTGRKASAHAKKDKWMAEAAAKPKAVHHPPKSAQPLQDHSVAYIEELQQLDLKVEEQRRLA